MQSKHKEAQIDLPDEGDYYNTGSFYGESHDFYIELFLFKTNIPEFKIDADAPGDMDEDNIRVGIYANPNNYREQLNKIHVDLLYTLTHEFEHFLQVLTDYDRVHYTGKEKYKGDSLSTLIKPKEIEPQVRGYYALAKKLRLPFDKVVSDHLDTLVRHGQIKFASPERKQILIDTLVAHAQQMGLPIILNNQL
jgi:hypothetical protein